MGMHKQNKPGYFGNMNLKPIGYKHQFTKKQVSEYMKCAKDPIYFAKKYVKVITLDKGVSPFDLYSYQEELVKIMVNNRFVIGKMGRQSGKTTTVGCCYLLHKILFNQNMSVAILANKLNTARDILGRIKESYEHLPHWLQQGVVEWNKGTIVLENGSKILASATSSSAIRGGSFNCISGDSIVTIKNPITGEIEDISISDLYANSSRISKNHKYSDENDRKQIQEVVLFADGESSDTDSDRRSSRKTPYNSEVFGWGQYEEQYGYTNNTRAFIGSSTSSTLFGGARQSEDALCVLSDAQGSLWEMGEIINDFSIGSEEKLFRGYENNANREKVFSGNEGKNEQSKSWKKEEQRTWRKYFYGSNWEKENQRAYGEDKQESSEDSKNGRDTSWNEAKSRIETANEFGRERTDRPSGWSMEQGNKNERWQVLTPKGFKSFEGLSRIQNQPTIKLKFADGSNLVCTPDHKISTSVGYICADNLINSHQIITKMGRTCLIEKYDGDVIDVYDLLEVEDLHAFYANNIFVKNCIFLDEFAHIPTQVGEEFFSSVYPTITAGQTTQMIIISTPRGLNMFYQLWKGSISNSNEYVAFEVDWRSVPQYPGGPLRDDPWKELQIRNTSERQFDAEFNCSFIGSANTLIEAEKLNVMAYGKAKQKNGEGLAIYEEPVKGSDVNGTADRQYFMTVDVARGQGGDNSAFVVFDITTMPFTIAARFKNNIISPMLLPSYIQSVGKKYNNAYVLVELNDLGSQVADILHYDLSYENLIKSAYMGMKGQIITETGMGAKKVALGVRTTIPVKKLGCSVLKNLIEQDKLLVSDSDIIDELTTFISDGSSYVADVGHTDDLVMCLVLFAWATRQDFFEGLTDRDVRVEIFNKEIVDIANEILPMFIDDGHNSSSEWDGEDMWFGKNDSTFDKFKPKNWLC
jgi:hypothetical protein